jgi:hypothetical protein
MPASRAWAALSQMQEIKILKSKIRLFEDRKISAADLAREIYHVAREIHDPDEANLRRALEMIGNKIAVIGERGKAQQNHSEVLELVDQIQNELIDQGY